MLDVDGYFDPLLALFDDAVAAGFLRPENRALVLTAGEPDSLLDLLARSKPAGMPRWITPDEA